MGNGEKKVNVGGLIVTFSIISCIRTVIWLLPAGYLTLLMEDFSLDYAQGGYLLSIVSVMMAVSMFIGSFIIDKIGPSYTFTISGIMLGLDGIICFFAPSFSVMMAARVISGFGLGLSMGSMNALIVARFEPKMQGTMNTINLVCGSLGMALAYAIAFPLMNLLGSYRASFLLIGIVTVLTAAAFTMVDKSNAKPVKMESGQKEAGTPSLLRAAKLGNVWLLAIATAATMLVYNCFSSYLSAFLSTVRMMSAEGANLSSSVMQIAGIAGSLIFGALIGRGIRTKKLLVSSCVFLFIGSIGTSLIGGGAIFYAAVFLIGFGYYAFQNAAFIGIVQLPGMEPQLMGGATAIQQGVGGLLGIVSPAVFNVLTNGQGMQTAFVIFSMLLIISIVACVVYKDKAANA